MTIRSRDEFQQLVDSTLPDNSTRQISPEDIRLVFSDLADSVGVFLSNQEIVSLNFSTPDARSVAAGEQALSQLNFQGRSTEDSSAFGYGALQFSYTAVRNTAIGSNSLHFASIGSDNIGVGVDSLCAITAGSGNIGLGNYSLFKNRRGDFNIAIGHGAGYYVDDNSSFRFYLGSYPDASGDCEITYEEGVAPLLYGDLRKKQLGIGVKSIHNDDVGLQVSGNIIPHESGGSFSIGSGVYNWDAYLNDVYISGSLNYPLAWNFNVTDGNVSPNLIASGDTVHISGVSGIKTELLDENENTYLFISAQPISGWIDTNLYSISGDNGLLHSISGYPDGLIYNVSGWSHGELNSISGVDGQIDTVSGWALGSLTEISGVDGLLYSASGSLAHEINEVSGVGGYLDTVSGWALGSLNLLSGISDPLWQGLPSGLIWQVSGWSRDYTDLTAINAGAFSFWELEGQYGASGIINHADTVIISGCSGVETILDFNENGVTNNYRLNINAAPVSGWAGAYAYSLYEILDQDIGFVESDINTITGTDLPNISGYPNGLLYLASGSLASEINNISGVDGQIDSISGWAYQNLNLLSGIYEGPLWEGRPSGLIFQISGWAKHYADSLNIGAGGYNHWNVQTGDDYSPTTTSYQVAGTDTVLFSGVKGIDLQGTEDGKTKVVKISADPLSGILQTNIVQVNAKFSSVQGDISNINATLTTHGNEIDNIDSDIKTELDFVSGINGLVQRASGNLNNSIEYLSGVFGRYNDAPDDGLIYLVSGWNKKFTQDEIDRITTVDSDNYGYWRIGNDVNNTLPIKSSKKLLAIGKDGISTSLTEENGDTYINISAEPLSGLLVDGLLAISGVDGIIDERIKIAGGDGTLYSWTLSDSVRDSQIQGTDKARFVGVSGITTYLNIKNDEILISAHSLSGWLSNRIDNLEGDLNCIKGVNCPDTGAECCDNVSGWALSNLETLSGISPTIYGNSGLIWSVSGWNAKYTNDQISDLTLSADNYSYWRISDGSTTRNIRSNEETQFIGVSGIDTFTKTDGASGIIISARPLSGLLDYHLGIGTYDGHQLGKLANQKRYLERFTKSELDFVSGINGSVTGLFDQLQDISGYPEGLIYQVSGWTSLELNSISGVDGQIDQVSGWTDDNLAAISGVDGIIDVVSGWTLGSLSIISGVDGIIDQDINALSGTIANELNLLSGIADNLWAGSPSGLIYQVSGHLSSALGLEYTTGSGLQLVGNEFSTYGNGNFNKVITNRIPDSNDPSGQIVSDAGYRNTIVNSSGYLVTPHFNTRTDLLNNLSADRSTSGAIVFAGDFPVRNNNGHWSRPLNIEGFLQDDILPATSYSSPTSGRLLTIDDSFSTSDIVWITNRDTYLEISGTLFCVASLVNNEYRPIYYSCSGV